MTELSVFNKDSAILLAQSLAKVRNKVYLCIGTDRVCSDSLGPKVGTLLNDGMNTPLFVYGMQGRNITAENVVEGYKFVKAMHPNKKVVVIDAGVGESDKIGSVQIIDGAIIPGAATNKKLPSVGDVSIVGIVADKNMCDFYADNNERFKLVTLVAEFIADAILLSEQYNAN